MAITLHSNEKEFNYFKGYKEGSGEMAERIYNYDWLNTSMGSMETWPQSLRTTLSIILSSKFPMFLFWGPEHLCFYNDAYRPSLGNDGKHPNCLGKPGEVVWTEIWWFIKPIIDQVMSGGEATFYEDQFLPIFRNGKMEDVYWTFCYSPVNDESGNPGGVFVTCTETTEKVLNLKQLQESKTQLEFAIESARLGTWDYNPATNKFQGNARLKEWFGLKADNEIELSLALNAIAEKDRQNVIDAIQQALQYSSGGHYDIDYTIVNPISNTELMVNAKGRAWFNEDKVAYRFNGTLEDITRETIAKKEIDKAREQSFKKFEKIANILPQIVWTATPDGDLDYFNDQWFSYSGLDFEHSAGQGWASTIHPEDLPELAEIWAHSLKTGVAYEVEARIRSVDKNYNWALIRALPVKDDHAIVQWYGTCTLIQDQKEAAQKLQSLTYELAAANEEISATNHDLVKLNNQLLAVNSDMDNFIYTASHDLKAPISNIEGLIVALTRYITKENFKNPTALKLLPLIHASIERFKKTLLDLTEITKLQRLDQEEEKLNDVDEIIEDIKLDLSAVIEETKANIKLDLNGFKEIKYSSKNLRSIFYNLISNSLKYKSPERDPLIIITGKEELNFYLITIQDNGLGMDLSNKNSIFGMFKRLHNHVEGSGIGLFIVKKIIDNAGGKIEVESKIDEGSTFKLFFKKSSYNI